VYNLNLPSNQSHNFHLFDEQQRHAIGVKFSYNFSNGYSVMIPIMLSFTLVGFCFFFVNYIWLDDLFREVFGHPGHCGFKHHVHGSRNFFFYLLLASWLIFAWFEHISFEQSEGYHSSKVNTDYYLAFVFFLFSEVMFFLSVFWAFLHFSLGGSLDLGYMWPPIGLDHVSYLNLPLYNTLLLITSGLCVTWSHNSLKIGDFQDASKGLFCTVVFGVTFLTTQLFEYVLTNFNINDSVFGSIFFFGTGFHGMHVLLGTIALIYHFRKLLSGKLSSHTHTGFLFTIWYWHFVDIIWLLLYFIFYIWGQ